MKKLLVVPTVLGLVLGLTTATHGFADTQAPAPAAYQAYAPEKQARDGFYDANKTCIGLAAGTAHHSCGTRTGGPSGGLH